MAVSTRKNNKQVMNLDDDVMFLDYDADGLKDFLSCPECGKTFSSLPELSRHYTIHSADIENVECKERGKTFSSSQNLADHRICHTDKRPFKCTECGIEFRQKCYLVQHIAHHSRKFKYSDVRRQVESRCGRKFTNFPCFRRHVKSHRQEDDPQCPVYGEKFRKINKFTRHMTYHAGEKPFRCKECSRPFSHYDNLKEHVLVHSGARPYQCKVCSKCVTRNGNLKVHMRTSTGKRRYQFSECSRRFYLKGNLQSHEERKHGIKHVEKRLERWQKIKIVEEGLQDVQVSDNPDVDPDGGCPNDTDCSDELVDNIPVLSLLDISLSLPDNFTLSPSGCLHPNIVQTFGVRFVDSSPKLLTERLEMPLSKLMSQMGDSLTVRERVDLAFGVVAAVDYLHRHLQVVHGMLSYDHVFVTCQVTAKVLDPKAASLLSNDSFSCSSLVANDMKQLGCLIALLIPDGSLVMSSASASLQTIVELLVLGKDDVVPFARAQLLEALQGVRGTKQYRSCPPKRMLHCRWW